MHGFNSATTTNLTGKNIGNYYSDYSGVDSNNDGIGETNYTLDGGLNSNDTKPLVPKLSLTSPQDLAFFQGSNGNTVMWTANSNLISVKYSIFVDNVLQEEEN